MSLSTPFLHEKTTDTVIRGYIDLPSGETAVVLDGGTVLVCKCPRLLPPHQSEALISESARRLRPAEVALAAISNIHGPDIGSRLASRREETIRQRDRKVVATLVDIPEFTSDVMGTGMTDIERRARTERVGRDIPDV
jgi:23S rRNA G2069 N7-methylase RlmK/C1962 C5-methylase RlmI